MMLVYMLES